MMSPDHDRSPCANQDAETVRAVHREAFRRAVRWPCQVVRERDFKLIGGLVLDLSPEGMLAVACDKALTGEPVIVSFLAPRLALRFDAEATIARVVHGRRTGDGMPCFGISFFNTGSDFREGVFQSLRRLPPPSPRRPTAIDSLASLSMPVFGSNKGRLTVLS